MERAIDWLAQRIDDKAGALEARRTRETAATDAWDQLQKEKKEQRVFRKVLRKAHPQEGEPEGMSEAEGLEFFASELGLYDRGHGPHGETPRAALMNYQKLALQMTAAMNQPVNPQEEAPMASGRGRLRRSSELRKVGPGGRPKGRGRGPDEHEESDGEAGLGTSAKITGYILPVGEVLEHHGLPPGRPCPSTTLHFHCAWIVDGLSEFQSMSRPGPCRHLYHQTFA